MVGLSGSGKSMDDMTFRASGIELTVAWTSFMSVRKLSSSNWLPYSYIKDVSTALTVLICRSQEPPIWLAEGGLSLKSIHSQFSFSMEERTSSWSISLKASCYSRWNPIRRIPRSDLSWRIGPRSAWKHLRPLMNASVSRLLAVSMWMARDAMHISNTPDVFSCRSSFTTNSPK